MKSEKGFSLIEVMLAIALLGIVTVAFLGAMSTASTAVFIADERATAESLARSQMEYVKNQDYRASDYIPGPPPSGGQAVYLKIDDSQVPGGYTICGLNRSDDTVENTIYGVPWNSQSGQPVGTDAGLQRVKLVIKHIDKQVLTLEGFKVKR
jgi:prepilin-type N-terminal cleavage/methylation domain-containing protein